VTTYRIEERRGGWAVVAEHGERHTILAVHTAKYKATEQAEHLQRCVDECVVK
jgi:hypothetical protein